MVHPVPHFADDIGFFTFYREEKGSVIKFILYQDENSIIYAYNPSNAKYYLPH